MKLWQKTRSEQFGDLLFSWRYKAQNRFFTRIFTWLLSAFVFGLLTAIILSWFGLVDLAQPAARIIFFMVFIGGIIDAYFENIVAGIEYRIYQNALVHIKSGFGRDWLKMPFPGTKYEFIRWNDIESIRQNDENIELIYKPTGEKIILETIPVIEYQQYGTDKAAQPLKADISRVNFFAQDRAFSNQALGRIVSRMRELKRPDKLA